MICRACFKILAAVHLQILCYGQIPLPVSGAESEEINLPTESQRLEARYATMLNRLREEIAGSLPEIDAQDEAIFHKMNEAEAAARLAWDQAKKTLQQADVKKHAAQAKTAAENCRKAEQELTRAQAASSTAAKPILNALDAFLSSTATDQQLAQCTILSRATPRGLAAFAGQGADQQKLVDQLLDDKELMKQMLIAGGAKAGHYGRAMQIYAAIQQASPKAAEGIFQRLALGTSLEHAVPIREFGLNSTVDPVKRYLNYEHAFLNGELDPAFSRMTTWEYRMITDCDAPDEQIDWCREMLRNYRPDIISETDYQWRYSRIVKTDVTYQSPEWISVPHTYPQILNGGGKCGPRAWFGRLALRSFGIPTWGVRQPGHAALAHWTPDGWTINLGADWKYSWWEDRSGTDFLLETQAREHTADYINVLRAQWIADALSEGKYQSKHFGSDGLWNNLALYLERSIVADTKTVSAGFSGESIVPLRRPTGTETITQSQPSAADRQVAVDEKGVIIIPAVACSQPVKNSKTILFLKSFAGGMQLNYVAANNAAEVVRYNFNASRAGKYDLIAQVATVKRDQHLRLTVNGAATQRTIALPYTTGMWQQTEPETIELREGDNLLEFARFFGGAGLAIKQFVLTPIQQ